MGFGASQPAFLRQSHEETDRRRRIIGLCVNLARQGRQAFAGRHAGLEVRERSPVDAVFVEQLPDKGLRRLELSEPAPPLAQVVPHRHIEMASRARGVEPQKRDARRRLMGVGIGRIERERVKMAGIGLVRRRPIAEAFGTGRTDTEPNADDARRRISAARPPRPLFPAPAVRSQYPAMSRAFPAPARWRCENA